jgi:hypothetical protein
MAVMPKVSKTLRVKFDANGLERPIKRLGMWTLAYSDHLEVAIYSPDSSASRRRSYMQLISSLKRLRSVTLEIACTASKPVSEFFPVTKSIMRLTTNSKPNILFELKLRDVNGTGYTMTLHDFHAFLQCPFSKVSVDGVSICDVGDIDEDEEWPEPPILPPAKAVQSLHLHNSDCEDYQLSSIIRCTKLRKIKWTGNGAPISCYSLFSQNNPQEFLIHASLVEMPIWTEDDFEWDPPLRTMKVLETLHIGSISQHFDLEEDFLPFFCLFDMPALRYLELVTNGEMAWLIYPIHEIILLLPNLSQFHVVDQWFERYELLYDEELYELVEEFQELLFIRDIDATLSVCIRSRSRQDGADKPMSLTGLSTRLRDVSDLLTVLRLEMDCHIAALDDSLTPLILSKLHELIVDLHKRPPNRGDLKAWLLTIQAPVLKRISISVRDMMSARLLVDAVLQGLPTFGSLGSVSLKVPVGTSGSIDRLKRQCGKLGIDFSVEFLL